MTTENPPKEGPKAPRRPRSQRSARLSRKTRSAHALAQAVLQALREDPDLAALSTRPALQPLRDQLQEDEEVLAAASRQRIGAARRLQGAASRRHTGAQQLFAACGEIRRRVKVRFRGPRHAELRRAFGEGQAANAAKPETVQALAERVLTGAAQHPAALKEVRVGAATLQRLQQLLDALREGVPERAVLRAERRQVTAELAATAARVHGTCAAILEQAAAALGAPAHQGLQTLRALVEGPSLGRRRG